MTDLADSAAEPVAATSSTQDASPNLDCGVCGQHALVAHAVFEKPGQQLGTRLICQFCGAHRVP